VDVGGALEGYLGGEENKAAEGEAGFLVGPDARAGQRTFICWKSRGQNSPSTRMPFRPLQFVLVIRNHRQ
jgi:hypothetical protein